MEFEVKRPHQGDKWYDEGDTRVADERDVGHLIANGILVPKTAAASKSKTKAAASKPKTKAAAPPENKTSD